MNTGVFLLGMVLFFQETLRAWAAGSALLTYVLFTLTGVNFLVELGLNLVLSRPFRHSSAPSARRTIKLETSE